MVIEIVFDAFFQFVDLFSGVSLSFFGLKASFGVNRFGLCYIWTFFELKRRFS